MKDWVYIECVGGRQFTRSFLQTTLTCELYYRRTVKLVMDVHCLALWCCSVRPWIGWEDQHLLEDAWGKRREKGTHTHIHTYMHAYIRTHTYILYIHTYIHAQNFICITIGKNKKPLPHMPMYLCKLYCMEASTVDIRGLVMDIWDLTELRLDGGWEWDGWGEEGWGWGLGEWPAGVGAITCVRMGSWSVVGWEGRERDREREEKGKEDGKEGGRERERQGIKEGVKDIIIDTLRAYSKQTANPNRRT